MKLNYDCIRDILSELEKTDFYENLPTVQLKNILPYTEEDLLFSAYQLYEEGYIQAIPIEMDNFPIVYIAALKNITPDGYKFLETIRDNSTWGKIKKKIFAVGTCSISTVAEIAAEIVKDKILGIF